MSQISCAADRRLRDRLSPSDGIAATRSAHPERAAELVTALARIRTRIADAAIASGREASAVTLIAVTKGFPVADLHILLGLGVSDIGESRDQEARAKLATDVGAGLARVHFIGQLQTNKSRSVARYCDVVHSMDRVELVESLAVAAERAERVIDVFLQVNLDEPGTGSPTRGGVPPEDVVRLADRVALHSSLSLQGVMAVAPNGQDPAGAFDRLSVISAAVRDKYPEASSISAGMSGDFELAIHYGSTHVRVGSALLGQRTVTFG